MPKEQRASSHQYRQTPVQVPSDQPLTHRSTSIWTAEDDETLMAARAQGMNWQPIATTHFPHKSGNACRKRHERLMEKRNAEDWDGIKLERLAVEYMAVRKELWSMLAVRLGEKWQNVESKCMEKGIKNISAAYKSALRKERGMVTHRHHPSDPDSGFGGSDTDAEYELDFPPSTTTVGESSGDVSYISAASESSGNVSYMAAASAPLMHHHPQHHHYRPVPIQPMPVPEQSMIQLRGRTMQPANDGRGMSIHAMLSPSPPGDDEEQ